MFSCRAREVSSSSGLRPQLIGTIGGGWLRKLTLQLARDQILSIPGEPLPLPHISSALSCLYRQSPCNMNAAQ